MLANVFQLTSKPSMNSPGLEKTGALCPASCCSPPLLFLGPARAPCAKPMTFWERAQRRRQACHVVTRIAAVAQQHGRLIVRRMADLAGQVSQLPCTSAQGARSGSQHQAHVAGHCLRMLCVIDASASSSQGPLLVARRNLREGCRVVAGGLWRRVNFQPGAVLEARIGFLGGRHSSWLPRGRCGSVPLIPPETSIGRP